MPVVISILPFLSMRADVVRLRLRDSNDLIFLNHPSKLVRFTFLGMVWLLSYTPFGSGAQDVDLL